ncbi:HPP family protein [Bradyrhizobium sp. Ash2021]|nr:HPP family protein [Bradyrhizobium sp. Ash2021]WMT79124.1 HPP family protein [Bradyrhizobium sp. Ash2021]
MIALASIANVPFATIPFATSVALVAGAPDSRPASNRAIFFGHLLSASVGLSIVAIAGGGALVGSIAVGLSVAAMLAANAFHPPAAISPLIISQGHSELSFLVPVLVGAVLVIVLSRASEALQCRVSGDVEVSQSERSSH